MSNPKKPGNDLAALKARLAQKTQAEAAPPAETSGKLPAPGEVIEQPAAEPEPQPAAAAPAAAPTEAAPEPQADASPFETGGASFDPNDGLLDVGGGAEFASGGASKGFVAFAMAGGVAFGVALGFIGSNWKSKAERIERGRAKGAEMHQEATKVSEAGKGVRIKLEAIKKQIGEDPVKGAAALQELVAKEFDKHPQVSKLFGWQLASVKPTAISKVFELYGHAEGLKRDIGLLAGYAEKNAKALGAKGGPSSFAILHGQGSDTLVQLVNFQCGEAPCKTPDAAKNANGFIIRKSVGGKEEVVAIGTEPGQANYLSPEGLYPFAIGQNPQNNAKDAFGHLFRAVDSHVEAMAKAEKMALTSLKKYADSPNVDADQAE